MMRVTTPMAWLALVTLGTILIVTVLWGFLGRITEKVNGQGVFLRTGGVLLVPSMGAGRVERLLAKVGDRIKAGQVVAIIEQPGIADKIAKTREDRNALVRERDRVTAARRDGDRMKTDVLDRNHANYEREISDLNQQIKLVQEQIPVDEELLEKGLIVKQTAINTKQKLAQLEANVASVRAQIARLASDRADMAMQTTHQEKEFDNKIAEYDRVLAMYGREFDLAARVEAQYSGQVVELKTYPGAIVNAGTPILAVEPDVEEVGAVIYVPTQNGKKVLAGMSAEVTPTTVKREEFGYLRGRVHGISDYPVSMEALMRILGNEPLARALAGDGPVTEIRLQLEKDTATPTGFAWSSSIGPSTPISTGTICTTQIITREERPVSLVIPYIREKLGI